MIPHHNIGDMYRIRVRAVAGLPFVKFHGTRHYYASIIAADGGSTDEIAENLGHADGSSATRMYRHLTAKGRRRHADRIATRFAGRAVNEP